MRPLPRFLLAGALAALAACNDDSWPSRSPTVIDSAGAASVRFWPPRAHALPGDFLAVEARVQTAYACARVLSLGWAATDSGSITVLRPTGRVELPAVPDCALTAGLDTVLDTLAPAAGTRVYLADTGGVSDSLDVIPGTAVVEGFTYIRNGADTTRAYGRFRYRDSTAGHPVRTLRSDSLESCEILQMAVFRRRRNSDTISVNWRTLLNTSLPSCAGFYSDTVDVVRDKYGFP